MMMYRLLFICLLCLAAACQQPETKEEAPTVPTDPAKRALTDTLKVLNSRIAQNPKDPQLYYVRGKVQFQLGDTVQALADMDRALDLEPENTEYLYGLGELQYIRGKLDKARGYLKRAMDLKTANPQVPYLIGNIYYLEKNYAEAHKWMDLAIEIEDEEPSFYVGKALVYRAQGDVQRAINYGNYALERNRKYIKAADQIADIYLNERLNLKEARRYTYYILEADSTHPRGRFLMGYILLLEAAQMTDAKAQRLAALKAVEQYSIAIKRQPSYTEAWYQRAWAYQQMGDLQKAVSDYQKVIALNPRDHRPEFQLGTIFEEQKDKEQALEHYRKALDLKPGDADIRQAIADMERN